MISLGLKFLKVDEGLLRDKITCYDHFISYRFFVLQTQTRKMILIFAIFFSSFLKIFVSFCVFPASRARDFPLGFDNMALNSF